MVRTCVRHAETHKRRARAARADYYLAKPFLLGRLEQIVRDTLAAC